MSRSLTPDILIGLQNVLFILQLVFATCLSSARPSMKNRIPSNTPEFSINQKCALFVALALLCVPSFAQMPNAPSLKKTTVMNKQFLYKYVRDDHAPSGETSVAIDASQTSTHAINPLIFGNFIEHLGHVVYGGLKAQALHNPNLEPEFEKNEVPPYWDFEGAATWRKEGFKSPRCVRLSPAMSDSLPGSLFQTVDLPAHRTLQYKLAFWIKSEGGTGKLEASIRKTLKNENSVIWSHQMTVDRNEWQKAMIAIELPKNKIAKGENVRFVLKHVSGGSVDVDQIELMPNDNVEGIDPDVLKRAKEWGIPVLRWPGGNFVSGYDWRDGVGEPESRPTYKNPAWGGLEENTFGSIEFTRLCKRLGTTPQLCINAGNGTPEAAAAWIRFFNDPAGSSAEAKLRATNGENSPFRIELCEVGNELYGNWQIGHTDAEGNAKRYVEFREALLKADPKLKLMATGKADEYVGEGWKRVLQWNEALLKAAVANGGKAPEYLTIHPLIPLPGIAGEASYEQLYASAMAFPAFTDRTLIPELKALILKTAGKHAKTKIAATEWGIIVGGDKWREGPNHDTLSGAIFNALQLNAFMRHSDSVTLANMTAFMHGGGIKKPGGVVIVDPQYYAQQMYALSKPFFPVVVSQRGPGSDSPARGGLPEVKDIPDADVFAALTKDKRKLIAYVVNSSLFEKKSVRLEVKNFQFSQVSGKILTGPDTKAFNSIENPENVSPAAFVFPKQGEKDVVAFEAPPHSLIVVSFER